MSDGLVGVLAKMNEALAFINKSKVEWKYCDAASKTHIAHIEHRIKSETV